jgi:3-oxoadipate enol-lactonase
MTPRWIDRTATTADGTTIAYSHIGAERADAQRLALVHSLALDRHVWDGVVAALDGDAEIVAVDCRGHGRSTRAVSAPFSADLFAHDLAAVLDDIGWASAAVAGCSMGGCVSMAFGGLFPARATALGLIDTTAWYGPEGAQQFRDRAAAAREKGLAGLVPFQMTRWFGDAFRAEHADVVARYAETFVAADVDCYAASCALLGDADLRACLPNLRIPVAIVVGEEDQATPLPMSQQLHLAISGSTLAILGGARHLTPIECPDQVAAELRALLRRV